MKATHNGTCQACGRHQAVKADGRLAKHGYTVEYGFFNGTCSGAEHKPLEQDTAHNVAVVAAIREWANEQDKRASGKILKTPVQVKDTESRKSWATKTVAMTRAEYIEHKRADWQTDEQARWDDYASNKFDKKIESVRFELRRNATSARRDADLLEQLRDKTFGNDLIPRKPSKAEASTREYFRRPREAYDRQAELKKQGIESKYMSRNHQPYLIIYTAAQ